MKSVLVGLPLLLCASLLAAQTPPAFTGETVNVNVINVDAFVTDRDGNRVTGLTRDDFQLFDDGKPVEIAYFEALQGASAGKPSAGAAPGGTPAADGLPGAAARDPLHMVVFVDNSEIRPAGRTRVLRQLDEFLRAQLSPGDRVMIVSHDMGLRVRLPFTDNPASLAGALEELRTVTAGGEETGRARRLAFDAMMTIQEIAVMESPPNPCPHNIVTPAHSFASERRQDILRSLGAMTVVINALSGLPGPKALLYVSDGLPVTPGAELFEFLFQLCGGGGVSSGVTGQTVMRGGQTTGTEEGRDPLALYDSHVLGPGAYQAASQAAIDAQGYSIVDNLNQLAAHANAQRVTLYTVQASGLEASAASDAGAGARERLFQFPSIGSVELKDRQDSLTALASATGGQAVLNANDIRRDLTRMQEDFATYYSLGFNAPSRGDGREHRIEVKLKRPGLKVRYRQSYRDKPPVERAVDRTLAALFYGAEDNPLEVKIELGEPSPGSGGQYLLPIQLTIPLFKLGVLNKTETFEANLRLLVATRNELGEISPVRQVKVPIRIPSQEVLTAMGQYYRYNLSLQLPAGRQQVAVGVRDETAGLASFLTRGVQVGEGRSTGQPVAASNGR